MQIAAYGRLGQDPREITTQSGKAMAVSSLAVSLADRHGQEHTQWLGIVAFGRLAELLLKHAKGEMVSVAGRGQANVYQDRVELQIIADSLVSARTARPGGGKRHKTANPQPEPADAGIPFDDAIPL